MVSGRRLGPLCEEKKDLTLTAFLISTQDIRITRRLSPSERIVDKKDARILKASRG